MSSLSIGNLGGVIWDSMLLLYCGVIRVSRCASFAAPEAYLRRAQAGSQDQRQYSFFDRSAKLARRKVPGRRLASLVHAMRLQMCEDFSVIVGVLVLHRRAPPGGFFRLHHGRVLYGRSSPISLPCRLECALRVQGSRLRVPLSQFAGSPAVCARGQPWRSTSPSRSSTRPGG